VIGTIEGQASDAGVQAKLYELRNFPVCDALVRCVKLFCRNGFRPYLWPPEPVGYARRGRKPGKLDASTAIRFTFCVWSGVAQSVSKRNLWSGRVIE